MPQKKVIAVAAMAVFKEIQIGVMSVMMMEDEALAIANLQRFSR